MIFVCGIDGLGGLAAGGGVCVSFYGHTTRLKTKWAICPLFWRLACSPVFSYPLIKANPGLGTVTSFPNLCLNGHNHYGSALRPNYVFIFIWSKKCWNFYSIPKKFVGDCTCLPLMETKLAHKVQRGLKQRPAEVFQLFILFYVKKAMWKIKAACTWLHSTMCAVSTHNSFLNISVTNLSGKSRVKLAQFLYIKQTEYYDDEIFTFP